MKKLWPLVWIIALLAMVMFSACSNEQLVNPEDGSEEEAELLSLEKEFGGYTTGDETYAFGDPEMMERDADDAAVADAVSSDLATTTDLNSDAVKAYFLRIKFGLLEGDSSATEVVDWSGSAEVNKGTLVLLRPVRFEENDSIVLPRESRQKLDFISFTKPHFDGLALAILDNDTAQADVAGSFTINAGSYSKTLTFAELDSLELIEPVGASGHEVSIMSRVKDASPFAGGFISGRWVKTRPHGGVFKGRWINSLGTNAGHLHGIWGIRDDGQRVFKGKYIGLEGRFGGLLAGHWEYSRDDHGGVFKGRWVNRSRDTVGTVKGHFKTGRANDRRGFFHGRYKVVNGDNRETDGVSD